MYCDLKRNRYRIVCRNIILTVSFQLENVPFSSKSYCFICNSCNACSQTIITHLLLLGVRKKLTQENRFLFCNKYGLFHGFIFLTIKKFLLSYFPFSLSAFRGNKILRRISCHGRNYSQRYFFKRNQSSDNRSHGFGAKFLLKKLSASDFSYERKSAVSISYLKQSGFSHREGSVKDRAFHEKENLDKNHKA